MLDPFSATAERNIKAPARDVNCPGEMRSLSQSHMPCLIDVDSKKKKKKQPLKVCTLCHRRRLGPCPFPISSKSRWYRLNLFFVCVCMYGNPRHVLVPFMLLMRQCYTNHPITQPFSQPASACPLLLPSHLRRFAHRDSPIGHTKVRRHRPLATQTTGRGGLGAGHTEENTNVEDAGDFFDLLRQRTYFPHTVRA